MTNHPITPPPELVEQWRTAPEYASDTEKVTMVSMTTRRLQEIADQAACRGADQQLEQCVAWLEDFEGDAWAAEKMRSGCRPQPSSLREQALALLQPGEPRLFNSEMQAILRRALEALPE